MSRSCTGTLPFLPLIPLLLCCCPRPLPPSCAVQLDLMESINAMTSITQGIHYGGPSPQNQMLMQFTPRSDGQSWGGSFTTFSVDWGTDTIICELLFRNPVM